ncbi:MAG: SpoIIE family protein phosphatase [Candidatus Cloacimonadaceae bacterium]
METQKKTKPLARQLISFMFIFMVVLFLLLILITRQLVFNTMRKTEEKTIGNLTETNVQIIDKNLANIMTLAKNLQMVINDDIYTQDNITRHIHHLLINNPKLVSVCLAHDLPSEKQTQTFTLMQQSIQSIPADDDDYLFKDWFQIPWLSRNAYWSDPWFDGQGSGRVVVSYSIPLTIRGSYRGIIRLDTPMENLRRIVMPLRIKQTGYAFLISSNGMIVAHPSDSLAMNYTIFDLAARFDRPNLRRIGRNAINGQTGFERVRIDEEQGDNWIAYHPLPSNHWSLIAVVPHSEVFADLSYLVIIFTIASVMAFVILAATIWYRSRALNQPLTELVDAIKQAGDGDLQPSPQVNTETYEIQVIAENFEKMKSSLSRYIDNLQQVTQEKDRIMAEVTFASAIQRNLIPKNADISILPPNLNTFGILEPAGAIGGDLFDYFLKDEGHFLFAIADVVGKGVAAAMTMTMATTLLRTVAPLKAKPEEILEILNAFLVENNLESDFVTMILGIIDLQSGRCVFSNAGHVPLYRVSAEGRCDKFATTHSTALGFFDNIRISSEEIQLAAGDKILVFTDGVTEAVSPDEQLFGTAGLEKVLATNSAVPPEGMAYAILRAIQEFADPQMTPDDTTILVIEYLGPLGQV